VNKSIGNIYLKKEGKLINSANFDKLINILDPINNYNNLGKSINYHSNSKMKKVIIYLNQQIKIIHKIRKKGNPIFYINSLFNLFKQTLSTNFIDLFANYINSPRILSNCKFHQKKIDKKKLKIDKEEIQKFNNLFTKEKINFNINKYDDEEDYDNYEEENEDGVGDLEEKDLEENYEEDEYAEEEEEEEEIKKDKKEMNGNNRYNEDKFNNKDEKIKFVPLINNQVIKKLFELYENKQKTINNNNQLLKESMEYSNNLDKFLKNLKLI
jgi:hypothetical protein